MKSQGLCKIGNICIAQDTIIGKVQVKYCSTHSNHSIEIVHLRVPSIFKSKIATKILKVLLLKKILDDVSDETSV